MRGYSLYLCDDIVKKTSFSESGNSNEWNDSDIRKWLNTDFYRAVTSRQKSRIVPFNGDKLFMLSEQEYENFMGDISEVNGVWWLRSSGINSDTAYIVDNFGDITTTDIDNERVGIRPAVLLKQVDREKLDELLDKMQDLYAQFKAAQSEFIELGGNEEEIDSIIHDINQVL